MASTLPNMSFCAPTTSTCRINKISNVNYTTLSIARKRTFYTEVKAIEGGEANLQRPTQQRQLQPEMKAPQASPKVLLNQFPVAKTLQQMMDPMERIIEDDPLVYSDTSSPLIVAGDDEYSDGKMPWAIKEGQKDYKIRFNMPGMNKNDVKVWVEENMLVVKAEKVPHGFEGQANGNGELIRAEDEDWPAKSYGRYNHRIALLENIEFENIKAHVKDGVLYITIPKTAACGKIIAIDVQ